MVSCSNCGAEIDREGKFCPLCGPSLQGSAAPDAAAAPSQPADPFIGKVLDGKFRIDRLLGVGGMGQVYLATQLSLDKQVCVKVLRTGMDVDATLIGRFHREARAASRLNHPNSITVIDFGHDEQTGSLYLAMEYVPGRDLAKVIFEDFPLDEARIIHIMDQVLSALADAHAAGIIHRDLKPENIMVADLRGTKDFVKVLDFGIAKIQESSTEPGLTQVGMVCGTPEYMSPEQARGEALDARSDLYAVGVILYQMVTGRLPFDAPTAMGIVTKHLTEPPTPPSQVPGVKVSAALENLIMRALSKKREGRPATALAMQQELAAIANPVKAPAQEQALGQQDLFEAGTGQAAGEKIAQQRAATPVASGGGGRKSMLPLVLGAVILLAGAAAALWWFKFRNGDVSSAGTHDAGLEVVSGDEPTDAGGVQQQPSATSVRDAGVKAGPKAGSKGDEDSGSGGAAKGRSTLAGKKPAQGVPEAARQFYLAGKELMVRNRLAKAISTLKKATKMYPGYAAAYKALGTCYMRLGKLEQAKKSFRAYLKYAPDAADAAHFRQLLESL